MGLDTDIFDGVTKIRAATLLGEIFRLHQCNKNLMGCVHTKSNYGRIVAIPSSETQE